MGGQIQQLAKREDGTWGAGQRRESPRYRSGTLSLHCPERKVFAARLPVSRVALRYNAPQHPNLPVGHHKRTLGLERTHFRHAHSGRSHRPHDHTFLAPTRVTSSRDTAHLLDAGHIPQYIRCVVFLGREYGLNKWRRISASSMSLWHSWDFGAFDVSPTWRIHKRKWREGARHLCIGLIITILQIYRWKCNRFNEAKGLSNKTAQRFSRHVCH